MNNEMKRLFSQWVKCQVIKITLLPHLDFTLDLHGKTEG
jgi:hypothetical protein